MEQERDVWRNPFEHGDGDVPCIHDMEHDPSTELAGDVELRVEQS